jgi:acetolactate synthase I/III small subunit
MITNIFIIIPAIRSIPHDPDHFRPGPKQARGLADMADAIRKYNVNIRSISAGETEDPEISRLTIGLDGTDEDIQRITEDMAAMDVIIGMDDLRRKEFVDRELILVKVAMESRQHHPDHADFRGVPGQRGGHGPTDHHRGNEWRSGAGGWVDQHAQAPRHQELCRSGMIALKRGDE